MEQKSIRLNFDLSFVYGPRTFRLPLAAVMMLAAVGELNSESVTLSTYYPAPSGVYTNMITTSNTFLARDGGGASRVGVGTTSPGAKLSVAGSMAVGAAYAGTVPPADSMIVSGFLGVGKSVPAQALDVVGNSAVSGIMTAGNRVVVTSGYVRVTSAGCVAADVVQGAVCTGARYATFSPGFYVEGWSYQNRGGQVLAQSGAGQTTTQVRGLDITGNEAWMTLKKNDSVARIHCCPR